MSVTFQDGVTPLNAANLNTLESKASKGVVSGYAALDAAGYVLAPVGAKFGADTNLYRSAAGSLKTDGHLNVGGFMFAGWDQTADSGGMAMRQSGDTNYRLFMGNSGKLQWGNGSAGVDTNLYRAAAGQLTTDGVFSVRGTDIEVKNAAGTELRAMLHRDFTGVDQPALALYAPAGAEKVRLGIAAGPGGTSGVILGGDTNLYRMRANTLRTSGSLWVDGQFYIGGAVQAAVPANQIYRFPVYATNDTFLGWVPCYS